MGKARLAAGGALAATLACQAGGGSVRVPVLETAFGEGLEGTASLPPRERHERAYAHYEGGEGMARSGAIREDPRLIAAGADRAVEGLEAVAPLLAVAAEREACAAAAAAWRDLATEARVGGRLNRPQRMVADRAARSRRFAPGAVAVIAAPPPPREEGPAAAPPAAPGERPEGVVLRKRTETRAGPAGEVLVRSVVVLRPDGREVEVSVTDSEWDAARIGQPLPGVAGGGSAR
ncbi:MAG: hypothetical protein L0216_08360 [Planctomycetales bacterium]|nr:hypothetical protein [Planctomycetales bacterium]